MKVGRGDGGAGKEAEDRGVFFISIWVEEDLGLGSRFVVEVGTN